MIRAVAWLLVVVLVSLLVSGGLPDLAGGDLLRLDWLAREAAAQAEEADNALAAAEGLMLRGVDDARGGQAAVLAGPGDPVVAMNAGAESFEASASELDQATIALGRLGWTLRAIDQAIVSPALALGSSDAVAIAAQWRAAGPPTAALADLRRRAEGTLALLGEALVALDADDPTAALDATAAAADELERIRDGSWDMSTLPFWIATVDALLAATEDIARAAQAGDPEALAEAQVAYAVAAAEADRADRALAIALGEASAGVNGGANRSSAEALRAVGAARDAIAALSILR